MVNHLNSAILNYLDSAVLDYKFYHFPGRNWRWSWWRWKLSWFGWLEAADVCQCKSFSSHELITKLIIFKLLLIKSKNHWRFFLRNQRISIYQSLASISLNFSGKIFFQYFRVLELPYNPCLKCIKKSKLIYFYEVDNVLRLSLGLWFYYKVIWSTFSETEYLRIVLKQFSPFLS